MQIKKSKTIIASGIIAIGIIIISILIIWKHNTNTANLHLLEIEEFRKATAYIDTMRKIALHRTGLLIDMRGINDPFILDHHAEEISLQAGDFITTREKLLSLNLSPDIRTLWSEAVPLINRTGAAQKLAARLLLERNIGEAEKVLLNDAIPNQSKAQQKLSTLLENLQQKSEMAVREANHDKEATVFTIAVIGAFALTLTFGIMICIVRMTTQMQKDLNQANEAKLANKMKSEFLAMMSHEIRTPLTAIIGYAEASLETDQSITERITGTHRIIHNGKHLLGLVNDVLDLAKVESGKFQLENIDVSPVQLANEVFHGTRLRALEKHLTCNIDFILPLPKLITGDPIRIKQVLINLLSNAIKFTKSGHIYLKVRYSTLDEVISFEVEDTGIGISEEQQTKIFDSFVQAESSTTRLYGGSGLGLSLTRDLARKMDGEIKLESKPGVGSRFTIKLKRGCPSDSGLIYDNAELNQFSHEIKKTKITVSQLKGNVLLVEDNEDNQRLLSNFLKKAGIEVTSAENGVVAIEEATKREFDLILMDMQMPVMDGPTATKKLRASGYNKPIVALTANAYQEDKELCLAAGCDDFVTKPITRIHLFDVVSNYLKPTRDLPLDAEPLYSALLAEDPSLASVIEDFCRDLPAKIALIKRAMSQNNCDNVRKIVHDFKGSGSTFGFPELSETAAQTEFQLINCDYEKVREQIMKLENIARRIIDGSKAGSHSRKTAS